MTLNNLIGKTLEKITVNPDAIKRLVSAAERNVADYSGDTIPNSTVKDCIIQAEILLKHFKSYQEEEGN